MKWRTRRNDGSTVGLAGWLFADLLLGLAMLFFVFNTVGTLPTPTPPAPPPTSTPTATPTRTPAPSRTATPTPTPQPTVMLRITPTRTSPPPTPVTGLNTLPDKLELQVDASALLGGDPAQRQAVIEAIKARFGAYAQSGQRAGIVLTFGTSSKPQEGNDLAGIVNELLRTALPDIFVPKGRPGETAFENFHTISEDPRLRGQIEVRVYLILETTMAK